MTAAQESAFRAASGAYANSVLFAIAGSVPVLTLTWTPWISIGAFKEWRAGQIELVDLMWIALRACIVLLALGFYVR
ncbi:MAG: TIGR03758 family integrating conjugative element protein [Pseudomonadales bacterium]|nr:TIGR03758 family integrating conjugative element protein [Pseudomonadales bacterium]